MLADIKWLSMALKNAARNRRRSLVTVAICAIGTAAALLGGGFALYTYQALAQASARDTGHLVLAAPHFFEGAETLPMQHGLAKPQALTKQLLTLPQVQRVLPRLQFSGLISNGDKSEIFIGTGVDPMQEFLVKGPFMKREAGHLLDEHRPGQGPGVVLGLGLAKILSAQPGSALTMLSTTTGGSLNAVDVRVSGVVSTGIADIDKRLALVDLGTAQDLLGTDKVSTLSVYLDDIAHTGASAAQLAKAHAGTLVVRTWLEQAMFYQSVKDLYNRIFGFLGVIVLVIVVFSVTNTLAMAVLERTREIGTLRALGATPAEVMRVFTFEGLSLGAGGALAGMALAAGIALLLLWFPVQMPPPPGRTAGYPLVVSIAWPMYLGAGVAVVLLSALASLLVSRRAAQQSVVGALSHV